MNPRELRIGNLKFRMRQALHYLDIELTKAEDWIDVLTENLTDCSPNDIPENKALLKHYKRMTSFYKSEIERLDGKFRPEAIKSH